MFSEQVYFQNAVLCAIVMVYFWTRTIKSQNSAEYYRHFAKCLFASVVLNLCEMTHSFAHIKNITNKDFWFVIIAITYIVEGYFCYRNYRFIRRSVRYDLPLMNRAKRIISKIPFYILVVLVILSYKYNIIFHIDDNGVWQKGNAYVAFFALSYGYIIFAMADCYFKHNREDEVSARRFKKLFKISLLCMVLCVLEMFDVDLPLISTSITVSMVVLYFTINDTTIGYDDLTAIMTKDFMMKELEKKIHTKENFYLVMIDVDRFKYINDTFGHVEGDKTLAYVGKLLRKICKNHLAVASRYGGDEFCIVSDYEPSAIVEEINQGLAKLNRDVFTHKVSLSIGVCRRDDEMNDILQLVEMADAEMYKAKQGKKKTHAV